MLKFDPEDLDDEDTRQTNKGTNVGSAAGTTTPSAPGHERAGGHQGPTQPTQTGDQPTEADSEKTDSKVSSKLIFTWEILSSYLPMMKLD